MARLVSVFMLFALLVQAAIPLGFMPGKAVAGTMMVICSGVDQVTIHLDADGNPTEAPGHDVKRPCLFSTIPSAHAVTDYIIFIGPAPYALTRVGPEYTPPRLGHSTRTPPATAPPA